MSDDIKVGYKQTELGVIPEDWEVKRLGDLFAISGGYSASRDQLSGEGYCYLHYGDIHGSSKTFIDTQVDYLDIPKLNVSLKKISLNSLLKHGDIVFVDASEDDEGTSKHLVIINENNIPFISGLHTIVAKSKTDELAYKYRHYCFQTEAIRRQFLFYSVGTKVSGISKSNIVKLKVTIPPIQEQAAIATALSDVDALLDALDRLIAKKRNLKQAAMQQMLTGQTRLPGFSGDWEYIKIGDIGSFYSGSGFPIKYQGKSEIDYPFYKVSDMNNVGNEIFMLNSNNWISQETRKKIGAVAFPAESIIFAKVGAAIFLERKKILTKPSCIDNNLAALVLDKSRVDIRFIHYLLLNIKLGAFVSITALPSLSRIMLTQIHFFLPSILEQTAIATVLSDMDAELTALEKRRDKTRALKQAMMQELLTGKTRLIQPGDPPCSKKLARKELLKTG